MKLLLRDSVVGSRGKDPLLHKCWGHEVEMHKQVNSVQTMYPCISALKKEIIRLIHSSCSHLENMSIICLMGISLQSMKWDRDQQEMAGLWLIQLQKEECSVVWNIYIKINFLGFLKTSWLNCAQILEELLQEDRHYDARYWSPLTIWNKGKLLWKSTH